MKCHTNDNSTSSTQLPHTFSYIVAIVGHNHFESPNTSCFLCFYLRHLGDLIFKDSISHGTIQSTVQCFPCSTLLPFSAIKLLHTNFSKHFKVKTQQIGLLRLTGSPRVWWYVCTIAIKKFWTLMSSCCHTF
jgi:hypothetical protein